MSNTSDNQQGNNPVDDFGGIFDVTSEDTITPDSPSGGEADPDFYRPSLDKVKTQGNDSPVYQSRIRFVANPFNKNLQKVSKKIYYLPDSEDAQRGFYVDCPSNDPQAANAKNNILSQAFFMLKDHDSKVMVDIAKSNFSRKDFHWMLVQVMIDSHQTDMEGKVKIFRFGKQIDEKLMLESKDNPALNVKGTIIHHPFTGKDFFLHIQKKKGDKSDQMITDYSSSHFDGQRNGISFDKGNTRLAQNEENMRLIFEYLKNNAPDLSKVCYKPWDDALEAKVIESVRATVGDAVLFDKIYRKAYPNRKYVFPTNNGNNTQGNNGNATTGNGNNQAVNELAGKVADVPQTENQPVQHQPAVVETKTENVGGQQVNSSTEQYDNMEDFKFDDIK